MFESQNNNTTILDNMLMDHRSVTVWWWHVSNRLVVVAPCYRKWNLMVLTCRLPAIVFFYDFALLYLWFLCFSLTFKALNVLGTEWFSCFYVFLQSWNCGISRKRPILREQRTSCRNRNMKMINDHRCLW